MWKGFQKHFGSKSIFKVGDSQPRKGGGSVWEQSSLNGRWQKDDGRPQVLRLHLHLRRGRRRCRWGCLQLPEQQELLPSDGHSNWFEPGETPLASNLLNSQGYWKLMRVRCTSGPGHPSDALKVKRKREWKYIDLIYKISHYQNTNLSECHLWTWHAK